MPNGKNKKRTSSGKNQQNDLDNDNVEDTTVYIEKAKYAAIKHKISQPTYYYEPHLIRDDELTPGIKRSEYEKRRELIFRKISKQSALILPAMPEARMSLDADYQYRQDSNFNYFTGLIEPYSIAVFTKDDVGNCKYILFVRDRDESQITWHGQRCGLESAKTYFGANMSYYYDGKNESHEIQLMEIIDNSLIVYFDEEVNDEITTTIERVSKQLCSNKNHRIKKSRKMLEEIRLIKSSDEIKLLQTSSLISSLSMIDTMQFCQSGMLENELSVHFEHGCKMRGATRLSYKCAVASGSNAVHLAYFNNNSILQHGDLVLIDCGCEYNGYASDLTRTFPVNGKFNPIQKSLYEMVLNVSNQLINKMIPGYTIKKLDSEANKLLKKGLKKLGVTNTLQSAQIKELKLTSYDVHFVSHFIGLDIHDCNQISLDTPFKKNMVLAIEPAVYIPNNMKFIPPKFHNHGIRIEDNILITDDKPKILSSKLPRTVDEIEKYMNEHRTTWHRIRPFNIIKQSDDKEKINNDYEPTTTTDNETIEAARTLSSLSSSAKKKEKIKQQQEYEQLCGIRALKQAIFEKEQEEANTNSINVRKTRSGKQFNTPYHKIKQKKKSKSIRSESNSSGTSTTSQSARKKNKSKSKCKNKELSTSSDSSNAPILIPKRRETISSIYKSAKSNKISTDINTTIISDTNKEQIKSNNKRKHRATDIPTTKHTKSKPKTSTKSKSTLRSQSQLQLQSNAKYESKSKSKSKSKLCQSKITHFSAFTITSRSNKKQSTNPTNTKSISIHSDSPTKKKINAKEAMHSNNIVITKFDNNINDTDQDDSSNSIVSTSDNTENTVSTINHSKPQKQSLMSNKKQEDEEEDTDGDIEILPSKKPIKRNPLYSHAITSKSRGVKRKRDVVHDDDDCMILDGHKRQKSKSPYRNNKNKERKRDRDADRHRERDRNNQSKRDDNNSIYDALPPLKKVRLTSNNKNEAYNSHSSSKYDDKYSNSSSHRNRYNRYQYDDENRYQRSYKSLYSYYATPNPSYSYSYYHPYQSSPMTPQSHHNHNDDKYLSSSSSSTIVSYSNNHHKPRQSHYIYTPPTMMVYNTVSPSDSSYNKLAYEKFMASCRDRSDGKNVASTSKLQRRHSSKKG